MKYQLKKPIKKLRTKYDIISIGDPVIDSFLFFHDIEVKRIKSQLKAIINWGDKLPVDKFYKSVAGNATNNATGSSRLGLKTAYFCVVASDAGGREIIHKMKKEKVSTEYIISDDKHGTNYHTVLCYQGERTIFAFHEHRPYKLPKFAPSKWVYLTSMPKGFEKIYPDLAKYLDETGCKMAFNPGTFQLRAGVKINKPMLERTSVLSLNKEEAQSWVGDYDDPEELCKRLAKLGPKAVVLTDGRKGAYSYSSEGYFYIPEYPGLQRIEATGAGDAFTTAYVAALIYGLPHTEALRWGTANAGNVVMHIGPQEGLQTKSQILYQLGKRKKHQAIVMDSEKVKSQIAAMVGKMKD